MILNLDASVVLRLMLGETNALTDRGQFTGSVGS